MMYRLRFGCCAAALAFAVSGCSMHPLPENSPLNFPRASTFDIVQKVRCEAQAGLDRFRNSRHPDHVRQIIQATSIGYDFQFVMTETDNALDGAVNFVGLPSRKASNRKLTVGLTGEARKSRKNTRTFRIVEDLADVAKADCSVQALRANLAYPIAGSLHVDDVVYTYVRLELMTNLDPNDPDLPKDDPIPNDPRKRTGVFSEHLEFRTSLQAGAKPTVTLSAVAGSFRLTTASVDGKVERNDTHDVIIAFAQDPAFHKAEIQRAMEGRARLLRKANIPGGVPTSIIRGPRSQTALAQANARARNQVLLELARLRNLKDDEQENPKFLGERLLTFLRPPDDIGPGEQP
jgi:hypothetical protein